jgi:hypothetical protein
MNIAVHIDTEALPTSFLWPHINWLASQQPQHQWFIFYASNKSMPALLPPNLIPVVVKPSRKNHWLLQYWCRWRLPRLLKKIKADLFISELPLLSSHSGIPQIMVLRNGFFIANNSLANVKLWRFQKKQLSQFITQANHIIADNHWVASQLEMRHPASSSKTTVLPVIFQPAFVPILWEQRDSVLNLYSNDIEYFYCYNNYVTKPYMKLLLKAFSLFKKRMKSSLQLVLIQSTKEPPVADFHLYKYRKEVHLHVTKDVAIEAAIVGASFAGIFLQPDVWGDLGASHCIKTGNVPIVPDTENNRQLYGNAAHYVGEGEQALADALMLLYKDDNYKQELSKAGEIWIQDFENNYASRLFAQTIFTTIPQ